MLLTVVLGLPLLAACAGLSGTFGGRCESAQFVDHVIVDVPVELGTTVMPGTQFTKTWRVQNDGDCTWSGETSLVLVDGDAMGGPSEVALGSELAPGETLDIAIELTAPERAGVQRGEWMLRNAEGELFGVGAEGDAPLVAELQVAELPVGVAYAFDQVHCLAQWHTDIATFLPCEGEDDEEGQRIGYVRLAVDPALEGSSRNNPTVIEVKPNNQDGGWMRGFFPAITIEDGDRFLATVGCMDDLPDCSILFSLEYELADGSVGTLGEWAERFDEETTDIEVDLSALAGEDARLVLVLEENGGRTLQAVGFWMNARIERAEGSETSTEEEAPLDY